MGGKASCEGTAPSGMPSPGELSIIMRLDKLEDMVQEILSTLEEHINLDEECDYQDPLSLTMED